MKHVWKFRPVLVFLFLSGVAFFLFRQPILAHMGAYLIVSDPLEKAEGIAVLSGDQTGRCEAAARLSLQGWAPRILITKGSYPDEVYALKRYGIRQLESHEKCLAVLRFYGVSESVSEVLEGHNESTADEAERLRRHLEGRGMEQLIIVTSNFHTRRSRMLFRRVFRSAGIQVSVQAAPPNVLFDPKAWWTRRTDSRTLLLEYQKLALYALRYW